MTRTSKGEQRIHGVRWTMDEWHQLVAAARVLAGREGIRLNPTDIIKSGSLRRAAEILESANSK